MQCENCSISLTYHKQRDRLECHYCGFSRRVPKTCPKCASEHVYFFGAGAEQLEEKLREKFPGRESRAWTATRCAPSTPTSRCWAILPPGSIDILVGTQMVAKGHDFQRVTLVGVVSADSQLSLPDFRAAERTFQLLTQVAGRAGRGELPGECWSRRIIPSTTRFSWPRGRITCRFSRGNCSFGACCTIRRSRRWRDCARHENRKCHPVVAAAFGESFSPQESRGVKVLGPAAAPLARLKKEYRFQFLLKSTKRTVLTKVLTGALAFCDGNEIPQTAVLVDMDPLTLM